MPAETTPAAAMTYRIRALHKRVDGTFSYYTRLTSSGPQFVDKGAASRLNTSDALNALAELRDAKPEMLFAMELV